MLNRNPNSKWIHVAKGVSLYLRPNSPNWMLDMHRAGRRVRESTHTSRQDLALLIAHHRAEQALSLRHGIPLARDPLIQDLLPTYRQHIVLRNQPSTRRINLDNLQRIQRYLKKRMRSPRPLRVSDFHPDILEAYLRERLAKGISPSTVNRERSTWASFFTRAARRGLVRSNPIKLVDRIPEVRTRLPLTLSDEQVAALLAEAAKPVPFHGRGGKGAGNSRPRLTPLHDLILAALNCGARLGELIHLELQDVDWEGHRVRIVNKPGHLLKDRQDRVIAANGLLMEMLDRRKEEGGGLVFPSQTGGLLDRRNLLREFKSAAERAGVSWANFRVLRATALTGFARAGAPMLVLREVAGHASSRTTETFYLGSLNGQQWKLPEVGRPPKSKQEFKAALPSPGDPSR